MAYGGERDRVFTVFKEKPTNDFIAIAQPNSRRYVAIRGPGSEQELWFN
jgi:hypothetical protein